LNFQTKRIISESSRKNITKTKTIRIISERNHQQQQAAGGAAAERGIYAAAERGIYAAAERGIYATTAVAAAERGKYAAPRRRRRGSRRATLYSKSLSIKGNSI
jgi:hypothetical protein